MTIFLEWQIRFQLWQHRRKLFADLQEQNRAKRNELNNWKRLEQDQQQLVPQLSGLALRGYIESLEEVGFGSRNLRLLTQQRILMIDELLNSLKKKPYASRTELLELLDLIYKTRRIRSGQRKQPKVTL